MIPQGHDRLSLEVEICTVAMGQEACHCQDYPIRLRGSLVDEKQRPEAHFPRYSDPVIIVTTMRWCIAPTAR